MKRHTKDYRSGELTVDTFTRAAPVQNTYYEAFHIYNAEILALAAGIGAVGETLQLRVTIDGEVFTGQAVATAGNQHTLCSYIRNGDTIMMGASGVNWDVSGADELNIANIFKGKDILVEVQKTTAAGASDMHVDYIYREFD